MPDSTPLVVRFGAYEANLGTGELHRDGTRVKLQKRPFLILQLLLERPGDLVARETFRERLWSPGVFVDFDHSLNTSIRKLRHALRDDADNPRFVETVGGRGYRFVGTVGAPPLPPAEASSVPANHPVPAIYTTTRAAGRLRTHGATAVAVAAAAALLSLLASSSRHATSEAGPPPITSMAVLPFQSLNATSSDEYLGLAMADGVITQMSRLSRMVVRPTSAIRGYAEGRRDPVGAGRSLRVDAVLDGSIQRDAARIRVTARLARVSDGRALWAGQFDEKFTDMLDVQDSISQRVAGALLLTLRSEDKKVLERRDTDDPEAYQLYLKGRYFWNKRSPEGYAKARSYFQAAIDSAPRYARAYAGLSDTYILMGGYGPLSQEESIPPARTAARKALELDPSLAEPHTSLASIAQNYDWDWAGAEREYRQAIALNPNYATAHHWYGEFLSLVGRFDEAFAEINVARALDPLSLIIRRDTGLIFYNARLYQRADDEERQVLELDPRFDLARGSLAGSYTCQGRLAEAAAEIGKLSFPADSPEALASFGTLAAHAGNRREADRVIGRLKAVANERDRSPMSVAGIYLALGDDERALDWLERAAEVRDASGLTCIKVNPAYDRLRSHPRFIALLRRMHLDQYPEPTFPSEQRCALTKASG
jgi:TolB-like protein/DNA-binding winged helix-turn-helix (wHTH) protein/Tfp pilus assembly protein PilF